MKRNWLNFTLVILLSTLHCAKDLRRGLIKDTVSQDAQVQGRKLLSAAVEAHGGFAAWKRKTTTTVTMQDHWMGFIAQSFGNPWPESRVFGEMHFTNETMVSRTDFTEGKSQGNSWGVLENSCTWEVRKGQGKKNGTDKDIRFIQRAIHYLNELPFRIAKDSPNIAFMDTVTLHNKEYHRVLATWGKDFGVSNEYDQYVLYINTRTMRIEKANYTVRDFMRFAEGCMHFDNYRNNDGILFPFIQTVTIGCDAGNYLNDYKHQIRVADVQHDKVKSTYVEGTP